MVDRLDAMTLLRTKYEIRQTKQYKQETPRVNVFSVLFESSRTSMIELLLLK